MDFDVQNYIFKPEHRILVDMDGTIADFEGHFLKIWQARYPQRDAIPIQSRATHHVVDQYKEGWRVDITAILQEQGFFANILPFASAIATLRELLEDDEEDIWICTKPLTGSPFCIEEKYTWVERYLGRSWVDRMIITTDKTRHKGRVLIDDAPEVIGTHIPEWEHVVFDAPYNRVNPRKKRIKNWSYSHVYEILFGNYSKE